MRSKPGASALTSSIFRGKVEFDVPKKTDYFPLNVRRLLSSSYYTQFKACHHHFCIPPDKHMAKENEWVKLFVFDTRIREPYA